MKFYHLFRIFWRVKGNSIIIQSLLDRDRHELELIVANVMELGRNRGDQLIEVGFYQ